MLTKTQQTQQSFSFKTKDHSNDYSSMRFLPMIRSFFTGLVTLSYTVTLYPFVRLFQWWFSVVRFLLFEIPKMVTKKASQFVMRYQWVANLILPIVKLLFVDLMKIPDKDVSNYLRIDVSRLRSAQDNKNIIGNITGRVSPVVRMVSDRVSSTVERITPRKLFFQKDQISMVQPSINNDQLDKLKKQVDTQNLIISKQKSKIEKLKQDQDMYNKTKIDLEKFESLRKEKDNLLHEKNRLEHTTLTQLQTMQEVQVMLTNQAKKIHESEAFKENLTSQLRTLQHENSVLKNSVLKEKEKINKFNSEVDRWNNLKQNLEDQIILLNRDIQNVNDENLKLKERNFVLEKGQKEHSQRLDAFEKIKHDFHDISIKLSQKEDELNSLNDSIKEKSKENELLKTQVGDLDSELKKISIDYSKLKKKASQKPQDQQKVIETPVKQDEKKDISSRDQVPAEAKNQEAAFSMALQDQKPLQAPPVDKESEKSKVPFYDPNLENKKDNKDASITDMQEDSIKEMESDRIKTSSIDKNTPFYDQNLENMKHDVKKSTVEDSHLEQDQHAKDTYLTPSWEEETIIEENKQIPRRKSQQQLKEGEEHQIYQASDSYVEELNYMLDDIEKGEIENVQFHSIVSNPKINGSLSKLDPEQIDDLLDVLENSDNVSFVDFSDCGIDNSLTQKILHSLSRNNTIEVVDLASNCVEPNSLVDSVIEFIENNHSCNKLLMKDWKFSDENLSKIVQSVRLKNKTLTDLNLDHSDNSEETQLLLHHTIQNNIHNK